MKEKIELLRLFHFIRGDRLFTLRFEPNYSFEYGIKQYTARKKWSLHFSYVIPTIEILEIVDQYEPIVEMGAGTGYWAYLLDKFYDTDIVCFDKNPYFNNTKKKWYEVQKGVPKILNQFSERNLFLCFPPYDSKMAENCLKYWKGDSLLYMGEGEGGCNANDSFFDIIDKNFTLERFVELPKWEKLRTDLYIFNRI